MRFRNHLALLALTLTFTAPAFAVTPSSEAEVEARLDLAKEKFQRGSELYEAGKYRQAVQAFMEADRLAPSAPLSFNIARAYERLNDVSGALRWYRDYVRRSPDAPNASAVSAQISALSGKLAQRGLQQLTVVTTPAGASVVVDGRRVGVTPFTGDLALGAHRLSLELTGYRRQAHDVNLSTNTPVDLVSTLEQEPLPSAAPSHAEPLIDRSQRRFGVGPWLLAGGGLATLGGALAFELSRRSHEDQARSAPDQLAFQAETDAMQRDKTMARVLAGVGGAVFLTGTVMLFFNDKAPAAAAPQVGFGCSVGGCVAAARGSF
jgi:tetratricopeptide (TPR) repeat protein